MNEPRACGEDDLLDRQRAAWARGERPAPEDFLAGESSGDRSVELLDLIYQEIVIREELGEEPRPEEYSGRFPELAKEIRVQFEVHAALREETANTLRVAGSNSAAETLPNISVRHNTSVSGYEILGPLGEGGMGTVYKARDRSLNRLVALKMIHPGRVPSARELQRFRTEAEVIARLRHPNIVRIHEVGEIDGTPYLSLELAAGGTLAGKLRDFPFKPRDAAKLIRKLSLAIDHAHEQQIVHRDLKPANILFGEDGEPRIADFGLAKLLDEGDSKRDATRTGEPVGTPRYMSPEQVIGKPDQVGAPADIHALGLLLYECLTGRAPFVGSSAAITMERIRSEEPLPPRRLAPGIPRDLQTICLRCLDKRPERRFASARDLAEDLSRFLRGAAINARPTPTWEKAWKWCRRNPTATGILACSFLLASVGVSQWLVRREVEQRRIGELRSETIREMEEGRLALARKDPRTAQSRFLEAWTRTRTEPALADLATAVAGWLDHARRDEEQGTWGKQTGPRTFDDVRDEAFLLALLSEKSASGQRADAFEHARSLMVERDPAWDFEREITAIIESGAQLHAGDAAVALAMLDKVSLTTRIGRNQRAACLAALGRADDATHERELAGELPPLPVWGQLVDGISRFQNRDYRTAERSFDAALAIEPGLFPARLFQALSFLRLNRPAEASVGLTACAAQRPSFAWSHLFRADARRAMGDADAARADMDRLLHMKLSDALREHLASRVGAPVTDRPDVAIPKTGGDHQ